MTKMWISRNYPHFFYSTKKYKKHLPVVVDKTLFLNYNGLVITERRTYETDISTKES